MEDKERKSVMVVTDAIRNLLHARKTKKYESSDEMESDSGSSEGST